MKEYIYKIYGGNIHFYESEKPIKLLSREKASRYAARLINMRLTFSIEQRGEQFAIALK